MFHLNEDFTNTTVKVLDGNVEVELVDQENAPRVPLKAGESYKLPPGQFHNIHTLGNDPSCYVYIFVNSTYKHELETFDKLKPAWEKLSLEERDSYKPSEDEAYYWNLFLTTVNVQKDQNELVKNAYRLDKALRFIEKKLLLVYRSYLLSKYALSDLFLGKKVEWSDYTELSRPHVFPSNWFSNKFLADRRDKRWENFITTKSTPPQATENDIEEAPITEIVEER